MDTDGNIYEKNQAGQYEKKWDMLSQDYAKGHTEREYQPSEYAWDGTPLYRRRDISSNSPGSALSLDGIIGLFVMGLAFWAIAIVAVLAMGAAVLAVGVMGVAVLGAPVIAAIPWVKARNGLGRGNLEKAREWEAWGALASLIAGLVVLIIAAIIGIGVFIGVATFSKTTTLSIVVGLIYLSAVGTGWITFLLLFITGLSPTAILYLRYKESQLLTSSNIAAAMITRRLRQAIGAIGACTVGISLIGLVIAGAVTIVTEVLSK
jgi:hypothetical protein